MINIKSFRKPKEGANQTNNNNSSTSTTGFTTTITTELETHYLWGNQFNGTQDVNGSLTIDGGITCNNGGDIICDELDCNNINMPVTGTISSGTVTASTSVNSPVGNLQTINSTNIGTSNLNATNGTITNLTATNGEITNLNVGVLNAKQAHFWELIIDKMRSSNGAFVLSPANAKVEKVEPDIVNRGYDIMWRTEDLETGKAIANDFEVNDQIICLSFNQAEVGNNYDISNKYYWAKVTEKGTTEAYDDLRDVTCDWHFVKVLISDSDGTLQPEVGDEICVLGNRTDPNRQNAIILSSTNSTFLDVTLEAPSIVQYKGIHTYELEPYRFNTLSASSNTFYGDFKVYNANTYTDVQDLINDSKSNVVTIQTNATVAFIMADSNNQITSLNSATGLPMWCSVSLGNTVIPVSEWNLATSYVKWKNDKYFLNTQSWTTQNTGIVLDSIDLNANDFDINWNYLGTTTTASDTEFTFYVEFTHSGTTYEKKITIPAKVVATERGTDAEFDRLIINQFNAVVTIDDVLAINARGYVQHIQGNSFSIISDLTNWQLVAQSNAGHTIVFEKQGINFVYSNNNYIQDYSELQNKPTRFTLNLIKNGNQIDQQSYQIVFDAGAVFEVKQDAITAAVQSSKTYTDGELTSVHSDITRIEAKADGVTSRVTAIEGDYITSSELSQTANEIEASVYDELNNRTGINVTQGTITLNANNTTVVGNLNLTHTDNGLTIYDEEGYPRINIQADEVNPQYFFYGDRTDAFSLNYQGASSSWSTDLTTTKTITLREDETLYLNRFTVFELATKDGSVYYPNGGGDRLTLTITITPQTQATKTFTITNWSHSSNTSDYYNAETPLEYVAKKNENYTISCAINNRAYNFPSSGTLTARCTINMNTCYNRQTYIGLDGILVHNGSNKGLILDKTQSTLQYGFNGIRFRDFWEDSRWSLINPMTGNRGMEVVASTSTTGSTYVHPVWLPFYNYTPMYFLGNAPRVWEEQYIINYDTTDYAYKIDAMADRGICVVDFPPMEGSTAKPCYVLLPPHTFIDDNESTVQLPVGYTVTIINNLYQSGYRANVYVTGNVDEHHGSIIVDAHRDSNYRAQLNGDQTSDTYVYMGFYSNKMVWRALHDTQ